jgi:hypothetical protein
MRREVPFIVFVVCVMRTPNVDNVITLVSYIVSARYDFL